MSQNFLTIPIGQREPQEFILQIHEAITETKLLIFERRDVDLCEDQTFALYTLTLLQQLVLDQQGIVPLKPQ